MACTSTFRRPSPGIRFVTPGSGSRVPDGSMSMTISSPGWITLPGIRALADRVRLLSSTAVGIGDSLPGMSSECVNRSSR